MSETNQNLLNRLRDRCTEAPISFRDYIEIALYSERWGYYRRDQARVGRSADRDFYTAESLGGIFSELIVTAAEDLLPKGRASQSAFIEIAAEPGTALLDSLESHPFAESRVIHFGDSIDVHGPVVIFANEWLDALPFHRIVFQDGKWRERGVRMAEDKLVEVLLEEYTDPVRKIVEQLPSDIEDGYQIDLPIEAEHALKDLINQNWTGLILLFDYGKTWPAMINDCPNGTARTFHRHEQGNDLLEKPGEKDITCDVSWTPLLDLLQNAGFERTTLESQESFLVKRATRAAERIIRNSAGQFSEARQTLMELIHPANMGQRFQVLWGLKQD